MPRKTRRRSSIRRKRVTKKSRVGGWNLFKTTEDKINEEFESSKGEGDVETYSNLCSYHNVNSVGTNKLQHPVSDEVKTNCENIVKIKKQITETQKTIDMIDRPSDNLPKTVVNNSNDILIERYRVISKEKNEALYNKLVADKAALDNKLVADNAALDEKLVADKANLDKKIVVDKANLDKGFKSKEEEINKETYRLINKAKMTNNYNTSSRTNLELKLKQLNDDLGRIMDGSKDRLPSTSQIPSTSQLPSTDRLPSTARLPSTWYRGEESDEKYAIRMSNQDRMSIKEAKQRYIPDMSASADQVHNSEEEVRYDNWYDNKVKQKRNIGDSEGYFITR